MIRIEELRKGNYVDVKVEESGIKTRCEVININVEDGVATLKDLSNNSEFMIDTTDKWELVCGILTSDGELRNLRFFYDPERSVYALAENGAWIKDDAIVLKYNGGYDLMVEESDGFFGCRAIHVPYIHLLQNAMADIYGVFGEK